MYWQPFSCKRITGIAISVLLVLCSLEFCYGQGLPAKVEDLADRLAFSSEGKILGLEGKTVYISLGQKDGVLEGNRFEVVRLGDPLTAGEKIVGYKETIIGVVEIVRVRKEMSIAKVSEELTTIQQGDKVYQTRRRLQRVAVAEFPYENKFNSLTRNIQDMLYTRLIQKGMTVVERQKLEQIMAEHKVAASGIVDLSTAKELGKMLGVEGVLVGNVADLGNTLAIRARLVDVEQGAAVTAAEVEMEKTQSLTQLLGQGVRSVQVASSSVETSSADSTAVPVDAGADGKPSQDFGNLRIEVERVRVLSDNQVAVFLTYVNTTKKGLGIAFNPGAGRTYLLDDLGNEYFLIPRDGYSGIGRHPAYPVPCQPGINGVSLKFEGRQDLRRDGIFSLISAQTINISRGERTPINLYIRGIHLRSAP